MRDAEPPHLRFLQNQQVLPRWRAAELGAPLALELPAVELELVVPPTVLAPALEQDWAARWGSGCGPPGLEPPGVQQPAEHDRKPGGPQQASRWWTLVVL